MSKDILLMHVPLVRKALRNSQELFVTKIAMGLYSISSELDKAGFKNEILNLGVEKFKKLKFSIADYVKEQGFKIVELSLHWHYQTYDSIEVARKIKEKNPNVFIVFGGYTASCFAKDLLEKYEFIDAVVKGEGEVPAVLLAQKIINSKRRNLSSIPNLYWRNSKKEVVANKKTWFASEEELNSYDFATSIKNLKNPDMCFQPGIFLKHENNVCKLESIRSLVCCLGRGCPGNCTWCGGGFEAVKKITGRNCVTIRSPKVVAKEFIKLKNEFNIKHFYICYDPIPSNPDYLIELFNILGKEYPKEFSIFFECFGLPTKEFLDAVKSNLNDESVIIISPELATESLRNLHKAFPFTNNQLFDTLQYMEDLGIKSLLYFATLPNETIDEKNAKENLRILIKYKFKKVVNFEVQNIYDFEPYAPWSVNPDKYNVKPNLKTLEDYYENGKRYRELW